MNETSVPAAFLEVYAGKNSSNPLPLIEKARIPSLSYDTKSSSATVILTSPLSAK
jgi:hypothetical protein